MEIITISVAKGFDMANEQYRNISELAHAAATKPDVFQALKDNPVEALNRMAEPLPDTGVYRLVVGSLGVVVVITVLAGSIIAGFGDATRFHLPDGIIAIGAAAGGALAGLLAPSPKGG